MISKSGPFAANHFYEALEGYVRLLFPWDRGVGMKAPSKVTFFLQFALHRKGSYN